VINTYLREYKLLMISRIPLSKYLQAIDIVFSWILWEEPTHVVIMKQASSDLELEPKKALLYYSINSMRECNKLHAVKCILYC
jgi:hypothetical protein